MAADGREPMVNRNGWIAYGLAAIVVVLDQSVKAWLLGAFDIVDRSPIDVLPFFRLTSVWNPGVAFGMLRAHGDLGRWLLVGFAVCVVIALGLWARRSERLTGAAAIGLIMGGAVGNNVIDRVRWGRVFDYLDFGALHFPWVFNVADASISVGVGLLILDSLLAGRRGPATA
ncbi:MAG TPA: signal peptidase II [Caulobacteraceae bacterium]|nr:signal peptidase II [Caulobacteraceae bacterium]